MRLGEMRQRSVLRRAALRYADHGWRVVPGAFLADNRYVCGPLCPTVACHPALSAWERHASSRTSDVEQWWAEVPFSVLLATGEPFDVIEVPERIGAAALASVTTGPVAVTPAGRWMFLVASGDTPESQLADRPDVVVHRRESWIPAPPTRTPRGQITWKISPETTGWHLPDAATVQRALVQACTGMAATRRVSHRTPRRAASGWLAAATRS
ncbi:MAG TPA: bifunctional DNA primase/polymerase [Micromonosporaceae bacterium]|nr:bifunctional DNA primase/polymerase [Micromonosporaceae bacterium]